MMTETFNNIGFSSGGSESLFINSQIAKEYDSTSTYSVGEYCTYQGKTYKCVQAINTGQAFSPANWSFIYIADEVMRNAGQSTEIGDAITTAQIDALFE